MTTFGGFSIPLIGPVEVVSYQGDDIYRVIDARGDIRHVNQNRLITQRLENTMTDTTHEVQQDELWADALSSIDTFNRHEWPIPFHASLERYKGGEFAIIIAVDEQAAFHGFENVEAFDKWSGDLELMNVEQLAEEVIVRRGEFAEAEAAGHGDWLVGSALLGIRKASA